jgi:hypothetical protein
VDDPGLSPDNRKVSNSSREQMDSMRRLFVDIGTYQHEAHMRESAESSICPSRAAESQRLCEGSARLD